MHECISAICCLIDNARDSGAHSLKIFKRQHNLFFLDNGVGMTKGNRQEV